MRSLFRNFPRVVHVLAVLWRYFLVPFLIPKRRGNISWAVRTRLGLERLGGAWVKLGQVLALRFDLLPASFCYELFKLLNDIPPFPYSQVREIVKEDLGKYPEEIFLSFEAMPFASASIGQVHRATLQTGERVAVKVQRPGIRQTMRTDIDLMYALTGILDRTRLFQYTPSREVIAEFSRWALDELDYTIEARHASILHQNSQGDPLERIPKVYWHYTARRVLTTEFLEGIPLVRIMNAIWERDTAYLDDLKARGYDLRLIAQHIDWNMLNQMYVNGYFHADIHPANLLVLPGNAIGYVDFGIIGVLPDETRESLIQYTWQFYQGNATRAVEQLTRWMTPSRNTDMEEARRDLTRLHEEFRFSLDDPGDKPARDTASEFAVNILIVIRRHGMSVSSGVLAYVRTVVTADTLRLELAPGYDFLHEVEYFFGRLISQQAREWLDPRRLITGAFDYGFRLRQVLDMIEEQQGTAEALASIVASTQRGAQAVGRRARAVAMLALVVGAIILVVRTNPGLLSGQIVPQLTFDWFTIGLLAVLVVLVITVIVQSQHMRSEVAEASQVQHSLERRWEEPRRSARVRET